MIINSDNFVAYYAINITSVKSSAIPCFNVVFHFYNRYTPLLQKKDLEYELERKVL
jgi:hypothetical protein